MEDMIDLYGQGCLWMLSGAVLLAVFLSFLQEGGIVYEMVQRFVYGICG